MEEEKNLLLAANERMMYDITAIFEVTENIGTIYKFGHLIATNKRLILYTKYPLIGMRETAVYRYQDVTHVDTTQSLFSFNNSICFVMKLVNKGNEKLLLELIKLFSNRPLRARNAKKGKLSTPIYNF